MNRLVLVLSYVGILVMFYIAGYFIAINGGSYNEATASQLSIMAAVTILALRLQNIGKSAWYSLGALVPIYNVYVLGMCFALPANYAIDKKLDLPAKIIIGIFGFLAVSAVIGIAAAIIIPMING